MTKPDARWQPLVDVLQRVRNDWPVQKWLWDERLECALSTFGADLAEAARNAAAKTLTNVWTSATLATAPEAVRDFGAETGGLRAGQQLFSAAAGGGAYVYCLWWPWSDRSTHSGRLGVLGVGRAADVEAIVRFALSIK
jgi:hypothetical protein